MEPIFDQRGRVCGWMANSNIYDLSGRAVAFLASDAVHSFKDGAVLGWNDDGVFWDREGHAVAFFKGGRAGPAKPTIQAVPPAPARIEVPTRPPLRPAPATSARSSAWSRFAWSEFIRA